MKKLMLLLAIPLLVAVGCSHNDETGLKQPEGYTGMKATGKATAEGNVVFHTNVLSLQVCASEALNVYVDGQYVGQVTASNFADSLPRCQKLPHTLVVSLPVGEHLVKAEASCPEHPYTWTRTVAVLPDVCNGVFFDVRDRDLSQDITPSDPKGYWCNGLKHTIRIDNSTFDFFNGSTTTSYSYVIVPDSIRLRPVLASTEGFTTYAFKCFNEQIVIDRLNGRPRDTYRRCQ